MFHNNQEPILMLIEFQVAFPLFLQELIIAPARDFSSSASVPT